MAFNFDKYDVEKY